MISVWIFFDSIRIFWILCFVTPTWLRNQYSFKFFLCKLEEEQQKFLSIDSNLLWCWRIKVYSSDYSWFHENGSYSVDSFNEYYLSILQYTGSRGNRFQETRGGSICVERIHWQVD